MKTTPTTKFVELHSDCWVRADMIIGFDRTQDGTIWALLTNSFPIDRVAVAGEYESIRQLLEEM